MPKTMADFRDEIMRQPWGLWWIQARRLTGIEVRRNLFSWKASWIYFLAFIPTFIILIHVLIDRHDQASMSEDAGILAGIVQLYYIRLGVFFGCLGIFSRLIRGEMIERSLHFYLLSPVRREVLLLAKFAAGSISAVFLFGAAILADFSLMYAGFRLQWPRPWPVAGLSRHHRPGVPGIWRGLPSAEHDVQEPNPGRDAGAGLGSNQPGFAFPAAEAQCGVLPATSDASQRRRGGYLRAADSAD